MLDWLLHAIPLAYTDAVVTVGSALVGALAGLVGCLAVLRRRSMVGDAMSHAALPGVCLAFLVAGGSRDPHVLLAGALVAGALASVLVVAMERIAGIPPDAAIGVVLSVSFSLGIVLLTLIAKRPDADQAGLDHYLFGQAAGLLVTEVRLMAIMAALAVVVILVLRHPIRVALFDRGFAKSVGLGATAVDVTCTLLLVAAAVTGLQVVGAILMVALLVAPAIAARQWTRSLRGMMPLATLLGAIMGATGALIAARIDAPTGPVIVLVATTIAGLSLVGAPRRGVLAQARARRRTAEARA